MLGSHMVVVSDSAQVIPDKDESALEEAASHEMGARSVLLDTGGGRLVARAG